MDSVVDHAEVEPALLGDDRDLGQEVHSTDRESSYPVSPSTSIVSASRLAVDTSPYPDDRVIGVRRPSSSFSSESQQVIYTGSRIRSYPPTRTILHRLWKTRERGKEIKGTSSPDVPEPDVLYVAQVFDATDRRRQTPKAEYQDSTPLNFDHRTTEAAASKNRSNILTKDFRAHWDGPIITISRGARAWFPHSTESRPVQYGTRLNTEDFDALSFERVEPSRLTIRSPFLYKRLRSIAGYYPSFFDAGEGNLTDLSLTHWSATANATQFGEPWYFLLHRYCEMEASVAGGDLNSGQTEMPDDAVGSISYLETDHARRLVRFLKPYYESKIAPLTTQLGENNAQIPFDMLWYIFEPGTDVYVPSGNSFQAMVVARVRSNLEDEDHPNEEDSRDSIAAEEELKYWMLELWYLDMSASKVGRVMTQIRLNAYSGTKSITSLTVCPTSIWDKYDEGSRRRRIMDGSKLLVKMLKKGHLLASYNGSVEGTTRHHSGMIVLDPERGMSMSGISPPSLGKVEDSCDSERYRDYDAIRCQTDHATESADHEDETSTGLRYTNRASSLRKFQAESKQMQGRERERTKQWLSDHQLLLLNNTTYAFALKTKAWLTIYAGYASEVFQSEDSIQHLVLDEHELKTIKALSTHQYSQREAWAADFIEGKGTGQIILLHGPPGVGKTYTVEAIAEYLCRPLLSLTVADIGTVETRVEQELLKWFVLTESWDAILLVDEADIFLERRQNRDLARNGLVSAFLRRMEYFQGLLFLTTNRVGQIDDAFISRVHIAIGYGALSPESRAKIWQGFFRKLAKERAGRIQITPKAKQWVLDKAVSGEAQLNGRDIRNALQTAITLAEAEYNEDEDFDPEKMTVVVDQSHFARVLDITNKFHSYVQSIRREDERKRAAGRMDRNDYFNQELQRGSTSL